MHFLVWFITFQDSNFNLVPPTLFVLQAMSQCVRVQLSALFGPYRKSGLCVTSSGSCCYPRSQSTDVPCHVGSVLYTDSVESLKILSWVHHQEYCQTRFVGVCSEMCVVSCEMCCSRQIKSDVCRISCVIRSKCMSSVLYCQVQVYCMKQEMSHLIHVQES